jgi:hypothetical protein
VKAETKEKTYISLCRHITNENKNNKIVFHNTNSFFLLLLYNLKNIYKYKNVNVRGNI